MAGHSKWANIKRQKARVDAVKGVTAAKVSRAIIVAARTGGADPDGNFQLRTAIDKAKAAGVPKDNIDRAIAKGAGKLGNEDAIEAIRYEGLWRRRHSRNRGSLDRQPQPHCRRSESRLQQAGRQPGRNRLCELDV